MNFKNKGALDCIVSFAPAVEDMKDVVPGYYYPGKNKTVDKFIFNREKGAKLNIQASNFVSNTTYQTIKRKSQCDPNPYLRNNVTKCLDGSRHLTHYPDKPDTPEFVRTIFQKADHVIITKTKHGGYMAVCAVHCEIRKIYHGEYSIVPDSVRPVLWRVRTDVFKEQLRATKLGKEYRASKEAS